MSLRNLLVRTLDKALYALRKDGYLVDVGWFRSFKEKRSVDKDSNPVPWIAYPAANFTKSIVKFLKFGSGASTAWWAKLVKEVDAVEHDENWFELVRRTKAANSNIFLETGEEYFSKIVSMEKEYDIVFIDGRDRNKCVEPSLTKLNKNGVIIWDDSQREEYRSGYEVLCKNGFKRLFFTGISPVYNDKVETSIFYKTGNCLGI